MKKFIGLSMIILSLVFFLLFLSAQTCAERILYGPEGPEVPEEKKPEAVSEESVQKALEELLIEAAPEEKDAVKEDIENFENITLSGPIEGYGTISLEINFSTKELDGSATCSVGEPTTGKVSGYINPDTGALFECKVTGSYDTEVGVVPYVLIMEGKVNKDHNYAEGTLTDEDGEVFKWNATKVSE